MSVDVFRVSFEGAGEAARAFSRAQRRVQDAVIAEVRALGRESREAFKAAAPEDTGDLIDAIIDVPFFGRAAEPRVTIRVKTLRGHEGAKRDAFNYLNVTRFGHRQAVIRPRRARALKIHIEGHRNPHAAIVRMSAAGVGHPPQEALHAAARRGGGGQRQVRKLRAAFKVRDWVEEIAPEINRLAAESERRLGRRVSAGLLR